ncbi:MAG: chorismate-binding protein [Spirochaetia bacterium]
MEKEIKIIGGERFTPLGLAKKLNAKAVLESASFEGGKERYSILMVDEAFRIEQRQDTVYMIRRGKKLKIKSRGKDLLDIAHYFADQHSEHGQDFPFPAGGIGFLSYGFAKHCDDFKLHNRQENLGLPEGGFIFGHSFIIFDHFSDLLYLVALNYQEAPENVKKIARDLEYRINDLDFNYLKEEEKEYSVRMEDEGNKEAFIDGVKAVKDHIKKGNLLQGVLSRRITYSTDIPALEAYQRLRSVNPSPYMFYIDYGNYQLFGASPEMHIKAKKDKITIRPIAGTRRRGKTEEEDKTLEEELINDEKERAEHLMLVDLARNDLGRICTPGTVTVTEYMGVERYSHVMHIVSEVQGTLQEKKTGIEGIRATFPAGTVSGAPKIKAVEIIDSLEPVDREFYAGLVGYIEPGGHVDSCITIRSALKMGNRLILQAGAGIVYDSKPEREYTETGEKLGAMVGIFGEHRKEKEEISV